MSARANPAAGTRFGRLTVLRFFGVCKQGTVFLFLCDCGSEIKAQYKSVKCGNTRSCGCLSRDTVAMRNATHGLSNHPEYGLWHRMIQRCEDKGCDDFMLYGARGIAVCSEWRNSFPQFLADMGPRPSARHTVDRINNDLGYTPTNCRWSTTKEQGRNRRNNRRIAFGGENLTLSDWASRTGIYRKTLAYRLNQGWPLEVAFSASRRTHAN